LRNLWSANWLSAHASASAGSGQLSLPAVQQRCLPKTLQQIAQSLFALRERIGLLVRNTTDFIERSTPVVESGTF
jgi:hypothetical protein